MKARETVRPKIMDKVVIEDYYHMTTIDEKHELDETNTSNVKRKSLNLKAPFRKIIFTSKSY